MTIPSGQWLSIGATRVVGTAVASIETSAVATPSAGSTAGKSSSLSIYVVAGIGVGCIVAAVFVAAQSLGKFITSRFLISVSIEFCAIPSPVLISELAYPYTELSLPAWTIHSSL